MSAESAPANKPEPRPREATSEEVKPFVGRWVGDIDEAIARGIREPMQGGRFPKNWSDTLMFIEPMLLDVRPSGQYTGGMNCYAEIGTLGVCEKDLVLSADDPAREGWPTTGIRPDAARGDGFIEVCFFNTWCPMKRVDRRPCADAAALAGEWEADPQASLAYQKATRDGVKRLPPGAEPLFPSREADDAFVLESVARSGLRLTVAHGRLSFPPESGWELVENADMQFACDIFTVPRTDVHNRVDGVFLFRVIDGCIVADHGLQPIVFKRTK